MLGLEKDFDKIFSNVLVAVVVESARCALVSNARSPADAVNVFSDTVVLGRRKVVVDDMLDVRDIETTSSNASSNEDGATGGAEGAPALLLVTHFRFQSSNLTRHPRAHAECGRSG